MMWAEKSLHLSFGSSQVLKQPNAFTVLFLHDKRPDIYIWSLLGWELSS